MTAIASTTTIAGAAAATLARVVARAAAWRRREAAVADTFRELQALTDRELADIGIVRADLRRVARAAHTV